MRHAFVPQEERSGQAHEATLEGVSSTWRSGVLRDMAWLLSSPDLVTLTDIPGRPNLATLGFEQPDDAHAWLCRQQDTLSHLPLRELRHARMGHYHERLWHYLLDHAPKTRLLARNVRIVTRRNTLGELDMLYRTRQDPTAIHLEVAIKFYLGLPDGPGAADSQSRWIGPGRFDSLAIKRHHMQHRQLPLSTTADAQRTLHHWLTPRDSLANSEPETRRLQHQVAMPGILYYPWQRYLPPPQGATPDHRRGLWCPACDWPALAASLAPETLATWLTKPHWLAPPPLDQWQPLADMTEQARRHADQAQRERQRWPQQLICFTPKDGQTTRIFIVPDHWPTHVPLPVTD